MGGYLLKLYVAGKSRRSEYAIACVRRLIDHLKGYCDLQIIDVLLEPNAALMGRVLAVPMLTKVLPGPARRLFGDLSNTQEVLEKLKLPSENPLNKGDHLSVYPRWRRWRGDR
ncbi:MAG: circadian clock protein KaiB [Gammaproteobacteria bacterium]|nr:circadian clock protein KaiB [Gammaproteobacteria bacterium]MCP5424296.1 circadian clock protein KaiB [Gammaproteobacteria bacterium]MCP5459049.1 circadian clock protein KaiB [Gammaproteobacteria bacterium]